MDEKQLLDAFRSLPPKRQVQILETLQDVAVFETPEGLRCAIRARKEFGRLMGRKPTDDHLVRWLSSFESDDVFYDIGANVGALTLAVGALHRGSVRVVSIEPSFSNFEALVRNLSRNGLLASTIPLQVALLDRTRLEPMNYRSTGAGTALHSVGETLDYQGQSFLPAEVQQVLTYSLDELITRFALPPPTRIKIDIDGFEAKVLAGATQTLSAGTVREISIEIVDHDGAGTRSAAIEKQLSEAGFVLTERIGHIDKAGQPSPIADYLFRSGTWTPSEIRMVERPVRSAPPSLGGPLEPSTGGPDAALVAKLAAKAARRTAASAPDIGYYLSGAHKKIDIREIEDFGPLAKAIIAEGRTGMDYDRLYTLWQAARSAPHGHAVAEVGTYLGGSAKFIAETFRIAAQAPTFYVCDTFRGHVRVDPALDARHEIGTKFTNTSPEFVAEYLAGYDNVKLVVGDFVETCGQLAPASSFSLVHIDVDVYPVTRHCLRFFAPRLAPGGLMVVDDYGFTTCAGAKKAVEEFIAEQPDFRFFHLLTGQAIVSRRT